MFVLVQNDPLCPAGSCLELLAAAGEPYLTVAAYAGDPFPDPRSACGVIILGGDMGVHDTARFPYLEGVRCFIRDALAAQVPILGICLGGQLLAQVAGATVSSPSPHGEKGVHRVTLTAAGAADPLFAGVATPFVTFQLHDDSFALPPGATLLAQSPACPVQAFRLGGKAYGAQFHPEVDDAIVSCWCALSQPPLELLPGFQAALSPYRASSHAIIANFLSLAANPTAP